MQHVLSTMAGLALRENDIGYARFLSGKVQAVAHTLEMGKYNEYSPMLDIVCAGKDVEGTYKVVKHLLDNVGTMYDFRKSGLYKHMKFRDIDEAMLDSVKEKRLEQSRVNHSPTERTYHGSSKKHSHSNDSFQQKNDRH